MSFELYLQAFRDRQPAAFRADAVRAAFAPWLTEGEEDFWQVRFGPEQSCDLFLQPLGDDPAWIHTLSIHRPCADPRLWQALYALLALPGTLLHYPGGAAPLAREPQAAAAAMPLALLDGLGELQRVGSADNLLRAVTEL